MVRRPGGGLRTSLAVAVAAGAALCGCRATGGPPATPSAAEPVATTPAPPSGPEPVATTRAAPDRVVTEPDGGMAALYTLMASATKSLDMTMYELVDTVAEQTLAADAARGVRVRVVLDRNREGGANTAAFAFLSAHGVAVRWAPPGFEATHEKAFVVDDRSAVILTLNLTSQYYPSTRDFAVVDSEPADVAAIEAVFAADFAGTPLTASDGDDLVWSPGAQPQLTALIATARTSVAVENEEMSSPAIVAALAGDARRGVRVEVTMTASSEWDRSFAALVAAGVEVRTYPDTATALYIHAKVVVVDAGGASGRVFVGSENFTAASLDDNRELGLILSDPTAVAAVGDIISHDFAGAAPWRP